MQKLATIPSKLPSLGRKMHISHSFPYLKSSLCTWLRSSCRSTIMAPGYRSPFDHHPPPPSKTIYGHHRPGAMLPLLAIILCMSVIVCLAFMTIRASFHRQQRGPEDDMPRLPAAIALSEAAMVKSLVVRSGRDSRRAMDSRQLSLCEGEGCGVDRGSGQQPLLRAESHVRLLSEQTSIVSQAARRGDAHGKASVNWHGTNTLNTSWGWMA
ncbi:hypothetical protein V8C44DRAFT_180747 [Trichoderma aethiopicum]